MRRTAKPAVFASIDRFLEMKQALGRRYAVEQRVLESVKEFMTRSGTSDWTQTEFDRWCQLLQACIHALMPHRMNSAKPCA